MKLASVPFLEMAEVLFILSISSLFTCSFPFETWFKILMYTSQALVSIRIMWGQGFFSLGSIDILG